MKTKISILLAAALAAFFMLMVTAVAINAGEADGLCNGNTAQDVIASEESMTDTDTTPELTTEADGQVIPPGTGTVIEYFIDADGKVFYTIMTADKHVFYLIIDHDRNSDNVYFLNTVTIADLVALAEFPLEIPSITPTPTPTCTTPLEPIQNNGDSNNMGIIFIIVGVAIVGAAFWYIKVYRPKHQAPVRNEEYVQIGNEDEGEYSDDWEDDAGAVGDDNADDEGGGS